MSCMHAHICLRVRMHTERRHIHYARADVEGRAAQHGPARALAPHMSPMTAADLAATVDAMPSSGLRGPN